jgi:hypothetical protein
MLPSHPGIPYTHTHTHTHTEREREREREREQSKHTLGMAVVLTREYLNTKAKRRASNPNVTG